MIVVFLCFIFLISKSVDNTSFSIFWNIFLANIYGDWHLVFVPLNTNLWQRGCLSSTPTVTTWTLMPSSPSSPSKPGVTDKTNSNVLLSKQNEVKLKPRSKTKLSKTNSVKPSSSQLRGRESGLKFLIDHLWGNWLLSMRALVFRCCQETEFA